MIKKVFFCLMAVLLLAGCENRIKILKRAKRYYEQDDFLNAKKEDQKLIDSYTDSDDTAAIGLAEAHYFLGEIYLNKENQEALAEKKFLQAIECYPNYYEALLELGEIYEGRKEHEKAEQYLTTAVEEFPERLDARLLLADVLWTQAMQLRDQRKELLRQGEPEKAEELRQSMSEKVQTSVFHRALLAQNQMLFGKTRESGQKFIDNY